MKFWRSYDCLLNMWSFNFFIEVAIQKNKTFRQGQDISFKLTNMEKKKKKGSVPAMNKWLIKALKIFFYSE